MRQSPVSYSYVNYERYPGPFTLLKKSTGWRPSFSSFPKIAEISNLGLTSRVISQISEGYSFRRNSKKERNSFFKRFSILPGAHLLLRFSCRAIQNVCSTLIERNCLSLLGDPVLSPKAREVLLQFLRLPVDVCEFSDDKSLTAPSGIQRRSDFLEQQTLSNQRKYPTYLS